MGLAAFRDMVHRLNRIVLTSKSLYKDVSSVLTDPSAS